MSSSRQHLPLRRAGRATCAALALAIVGIGLPAHATPTPAPAPSTAAPAGQVSAADVAASKAKADELARQVSEQSAALAAAKAKISELQRQVEDARTAAAVARDAATNATQAADAQKAQAQVAANTATERRGELGRWAADAYMKGNTSDAQDFVGLLESRNTDDLAQKMQAHRMVGRWRGNTVVSMDKAEAEQKQAAAAAVLAQGDALAAQTEAEGAEARANQLLAEQQTQIQLVSQLLAGTQADATAASTKAQTDANTLAAAEAVAAAVRSGSASSSASPEDLARQQAELAALPPGTARATMLATAESLKGIPYVWGGTTTSGFDCSGYTGYVYRSAGISLPRTAREQQAYLPKVSDPQPGDLVFYGSPAHHVGIYAGGGMMWHAPHTGDVVKLAKVYGTPTNYGRPAGL